MAASATTPVSSGRALSKTMIGILVTILILLALVMGAIKALSSSSTASWMPWNAPAPQPQGRCENAFAQDDLGTYDFSKSPKNSIPIAPGSATELCYGAKVSMPEERWKTWGAQFTPTPEQKGPCVAWLSYIYPNGGVRIIGPLYGPKLDLSDMPDTWRIASNCTIEYYRW